PPPAPSATPTLPPTPTPTPTLAATPTPTPTPTGGETVFSVSADAQIKSTSPDGNYGTYPTIRANTSSSYTYRSYLTFDLAGISGSVTSATLRLFVTDGSPDGGRVAPVSSSWSESTL